MTYGFRCVGDHGVIQIDDQFANLALIASGRAFTDYQHPGGQFTRYATITVNVPDAGVYPMIGYNDADDKSAWFWIWDHQINGTQHTWRVAANAAQGWAGTNFSWYVFARPTNPTAGYGLRVRDANNRITFDSGYRYMKVIGAHSTTVRDMQNGGNVGGGANGPLSIGVGEKCILMFGMNGWQNEEIADDFGYRWTLLNYAYRLVNDTTAQAYGRMFAIVLRRGATPIPGFWKTRPQLSCFFVSDAAIR